MKLDPGRTDRSALSDRVYGLLKTQIIGLELAPGAHLKVDGLASELGVSPTPVREALNRLAAEGIVAASPYRGFDVTRLLTFEELAELLGARRVLETSAVKQGAEVCTAADLKSMASLVTEMEELTKGDVLDARKFNAADAAFHRVAVAASGNRFMLRAFDSLHAHVQISRHYQRRSIVEAQISNREHQRLLTAFASQDGGAASEEAGDHLDGVLARLEIKLIGAEKLSREEVG